MIGIRNRREVLSRIVCRAMGQLLADVEAGYVPFDVPGFAECHDYRDANYYGFIVTAENDWLFEPEILEAFAGIDPESNEAADKFDLYDDCQHILDLWIRSGEMRLVAAVECQD